LVLRADRSRADVIEMPVLVVEAEQERRDRLSAALLPADPCHHAIRRLVRFDLDDAVPRAGEVGQPELLRDHAVEARGLERPQPLGSLLDVVGDRRQLETLADLLQLGAPLLDRALVQLPSLPEQQVEGDEGGRDLRRELADAAFGRVEAHLHRVEVERAVAGDHDLAVERRALRHQLA
jgi:hypothetical protein